MTSDPAWEAFAAREPYFAVLTSPAFRRVNLTDAQRDAFFASGEALVDAAFRTIQLRLAPHFAPTAILEYGCGVGRLACPLARRAGRRAGQVTAVDRSPAMIAAAHAEAAREQVANITFETVEAFDAGDRTFDLITCHLVLQRLRPAAGLSLIRRLVARLAPGGIGVFEVPYTTRASSFVRATRWMRAHVTAVNAVVNLARRAPWRDPFVPAHLYRVDDVLRLVQAAGVAGTYVTLEEHADLGTATIFVETPMAGAFVSAKEAPAATEAAADRREGAIQVRDVIAATSIEDLNAAADRYFRALTDPDHQLAKPFSSAQEAPPLLADVAVVLQGLRLAPGLTVLDFGAGTGWLSHMLTQLGCRVVLLDVSATALDLARELYRRVPPIGERPAPRFLTFDGRRIDLPDGSVDRIVSFHAFHHAPNPEAVIREFGRVLAPGGIAAFAEPGPRHSQSAQSQFEMRAHGVVENDVDVHALWLVAQAAGFSDVRLAVFHSLPFHVSLAEYEDLLAGGPTSTAWLGATRVFLREVRNFFLVKGGARVPDSRSVEGLASEVFVVSAPARVSVGQPIAIDVRVSNTGTAVWLPGSAGPGGVSLGAQVYGVTDSRVAPDAVAERLTTFSREVRPGEMIDVRVLLDALPPGSYSVQFDCVAAGVTWFAQVGSSPSRVAIDVPSPK